MILIFSYFLHIHILNYSTVGSWGSRRAGSQWFIFFQVISWQYNFLQLMQYLLFLKSDKWYVLEVCVWDYLHWKWEVLHFFFHLPQSGDIGGFRVSRCWKTVHFLDTVIWNDKEKTLGEQAIAEEIFKIREMQRHQIKKHYYDHW